MTQQSISTKEAIIGDAIIGCPPYALAEWIAAALTHGYNRADAHAIAQRIERIIDGQDRRPASAPKAAGLLAKSWRMVK